MKRDSLVYLISGTFFGVLVGWILGSQQGGPGLSGSPAPTTVAASPSSTASPEAQAPPLDVQRAGALEKTATSQPSNAAVRVELANLYYDAQRFDLATPWYEAALKLDPRNIDASTDLAVCYHYQNQTDRALAQIDKSLAINPKHTKTLLNQGFIRAFGKQDLAGAAESWQKVVDAAPTSDDAARAKQALDGLKANHPAATGGRGGVPDPSPAPADLG
jgi:cytochrome c-type biogenesis protein CcmH/NrfG